MTKFKKYFCGAVSVVAILCTTKAQADVPVIDFSQLLQWSQSIANEIKAYSLQAEQYVGEQLSWAKQLQQYSTQLQQYQQEIQLFMNFYHSPSLGAAMGALSSVGLGSALPVNPYTILGLMNGVQYGGGGLPQLLNISSSLSSLTSGSYASAHVFEPTDGSWASQQLIARANGIAGAEGAAQASYADLQAHQGALDPLRTNLLSSVDTKGVLDATGQINTEIAWNVNQLAKQQALTATYEAHRDSIVQRDNEKLDQDLEAFLATAPIP